MRKRYSWLDNLLARLAYSTDLQDAVFLALCLGLLVAALLICGGG